jgi:hypothetical protein
MDISVSLPLDGGFLRRQCPNCGRQFKWHHGPTDERPHDFIDPPLYFCPYCGEASTLDKWLTDEQREYMLGMAAGPATREITDELQRVVGRHTSKFLKMSVRPSSEPEPPDPLVETNDMMAVSSPCHPWEPVKIADDWREPIHCLVCGGSFAV